MDHQCSYVRDSQACLHLCNIWQLYLTSFSGTFQVKHKLWISSTAFYYFFLFNYEHWQQLWIQNKVFGTLGKIKNSSDILCSSTQFNHNHTTKVTFIQLLALSSHSPSTALFCKYAPRPFHFKIQMYMKFGFANTPSNHNKIQRQFLKETHTVIPTYLTNQT